ncbi:Hypothetical predicted protein [Podarcis lilfordi]|uniref:Uncharacterized protein n=1 Tax=Podarcis lilfordi TaxID=74358 RepID=A0AA35K2R1_9SAUR|nr:Hypothetical predicted protein [Podarcis lilfordi]
MCKKSINIIQNGVKKPNHNRKKSSYEQQLHFFSSCFRRVDSADQKLKRHRIHFSYTYVHFNNQMTVPTHPTSPHNNHLGFILATTASNQQYESRGTSRYSDTLG